MTVGSIVGIIFFVILCIGGICVSVCALPEYRNWCIAGVLISLVVCGAAIWGICFWQFGTEEGARALKTQESNFNGGIERTVRVYDVEGELIEEYKGKFDVESNADSPTPYIIFDDEEGKRHMIYYPAGIMIIDEN